MVAVEDTHETVPVASLKPHPRNYQSHPPAQIAELIQSIKDHGIYRNVVIANDGTILAGHGVVLAVQKMKRKTIPVYRMPLAPDDPRALKLLAGDNEIGMLAGIDRLLLSEILTEIRDVDSLLGTGVDDEMLDSLLRNVELSGLGTVDATAEWDESGMPDYESDGHGDAYRTTVHFQSDEDADRFFAQLGHPKEKTFWWPEPRKHEDRSDIRIAGTTETT